MHTQTIAYELKYCERCGALGLRRARSAETYCRPCGHVLTNIVLPGNRVPLKLASTKLPAADKPPLVFLAETRPELALPRRP